MGQKVHPIGFRLGVSAEPSSRWYGAGKDFAKFLKEDELIRQFLAKRLKGASVARVEITRQSKKVVVLVYSARPGVVIGKKGNDTESLKAQLLKIVPGSIVELKIVELKNPECNATLIGQSIADQLEKRIPFRRAMKKAIEAAKMGVLGIKVQVSGRLNGTDIARTEWYREGSVPLHTLRSNIDFSIVEAKTTYGLLGVKVWICHKQ
jgi:small subunit ribosomal protein S3